MKPERWVVFFLLILSVISGYLMSKASMLGRAGMSIFYREYNFLKVWWKGALLVSVFLLGLFALHGMIQKKTAPNKARTFHLIAFVFALTGLYFTYNDFRHTLSHRLLGERFHLGVYLFWVGWLVTSVLYLLRLNTGSDIKKTIDGPISSSTSSH
ncbi:MAG: cytochrome d ubiquinol oxidase subunit II [Chitinophagaceae bacterium]